MAVAIIVALVAVGLSTRSAGREEHAKTRPWSARSATAPWLLTTAVSSCSPPGIARTAASGYSAIDGIPVAAQSAQIVKQSD